MYAIIKSLEIGASHLYGVQESAEEDISEFDLCELDFHTCRCNMSLKLNHSERLYYCGLVSEICLYAWENRD